jgi:tRNA pseudouridine38-40 synthase
MSRYFLEVAYRGTNYSGFQIQENAVTVQFEVEKALGIFFKQKIELTGSSRTDAGVHALQNFFHFDTDLPVTDSQLYNINALLPEDIVAKNFYLVKKEAHCRFLARSREYRYVIYQRKNPFLRDRAWYYPYQINMDLLQQAAGVLKECRDFSSFSKRNTQVKTFFCNIQSSYWSKEEDQLIYHVSSNRFLRGMVKGMVGTMLKVGRGLITVERLRQIIEAQDNTLADFTTPPQGLFLVAVLYPDGVLE